MPEEMEARTRRGICCIDERTVSVVPECEVFDKVVKVPGKIINPASKSQVLRPARMLCDVGIVSRARSMRMYSVWGAGKVPAG